MAVVIHKLKFKASEPGDRVLAGWHWARQGIGQAVMRTSTTTVNLYTVVILVAVIAEHMACSCI